MGESKTEMKCIICQLPIADEEEQKWAENQENHPGVLGTLHKKCYDKVCQERPETPWEDPISGEVDYGEMADDLGIWPGTEDDIWEQEEGDYY